MRICIFFMLFLSTSLAWGEYRLSDAEINDLFTKEDVKKSGLLGAFAKKRGSTRFFKRSF